MFIDCKLNFNFTIQYVLNHRYRPYYSKYKDFLLISVRRYMYVLTFISYSVPKPRCRPPNSDYNIFFYMLQNHSSVLFTICVYEILSSYSVLKLRYGHLTLNIKTFTTSKKSFKCDNNKLCLLVSDECVF